MKFRLFLAMTIFFVVALILVQCASFNKAADDKAANVAKMAAIFPGVVADSDYNTMGYLGLLSVKEEMGLETAYSENVSVSDAEKVIREYIDSGYGIIFTHGGQFMSTTVEMAKLFPDVSFIGEGDGAVDAPSSNLWIIDRNFQVGFYGIGALAALQSKTGKIGYLGGLTLPCSYAEVHAMQQAIDDLGLDVVLTPVWVGSFNDPDKARKFAVAMIADGNDVLVGSLNQGMQGVFAAVKSADEKVWVTTKYTDKSSFVPDNYLVSLLYDFAGPLKVIVGNIIGGNTGGYYPLGFETGVSLQLTEQVPDDVRARVDGIVADVISGKIQVVENDAPLGGGQ